LEGSEKESWEAMFEDVPQPLSAEERKQWLAKMFTDVDSEEGGAKGVACASDAFFPFPDNVHRARRSGVKYLSAPGGSVMDDACVKVADEYGMVVARTELRLFHH
jgi:phosphoribosylaminoimidazolecarboxamide formyltransferase/IMP cyclohydrolase